MISLSLSLASLQALFHLDTDRLTYVVEAFSGQMADGLTGRPSSLAMLPSYLTCPDRREHGDYMALDFGGTNIRAMLIRLLGQGRFAVLAHRTAPLADPAGGYDYTAAPAKELFDFVASLIAEIAPPQKTVALGHTFSFPCRQNGLNDAVLLYWTKEFTATGVVGNNVNTLLQQALADRGLSTIIPAAVVNDTVTTLLTAAYSTPDATIGSICGTGHNTCYLEPQFPGGTRPMYVNIESGNFAAVPANPYDDLLDSASDRPGSGRLEKMCGGRYIGELLRLVGLDLFRHHRFITENLPTRWHEPYSVTAKDLAELLQPASPSSPLLTALAAPDQHVLRMVAELITVRSAHLVAATWIAIVRRIDPDLVRPHVIAIDGSLYEKLPGYSAAIDVALSSLLGEKASQITCRLVKDGSGVGSALAACQGEKKGMC